MAKKNTTIKPFIKWAGGKSQLLSDLQKRYPMNHDRSIIRYCEPFVGGGAVLFDILSKFEMANVLINDINSELINAYIQVRDSIYGLLDLLEQIQDEYWSINQQQREVFYYEKRELFNSLKLKENNKIDLIKASLFIFLNRTCFNGLYRVNKQGQFNVPIGRYKQPIICDTENLTSVSEALKKVEIKCVDFGECLNFIDNKTFVYIDPPYRPLNETALFTSYTSNNFDDKEQIRLSKFVHDINLIGAKVIISNSDPKNINHEDNFFDDLYKAYYIKRITAKRMINCNGDSRGNISELLITNF